MLHFHVIAFLVILISVYFQISNTESIKSYTKRHINEAFPSNSILHRVFLNSNPQATLKEKFLGNSQYTNTLVSEDGGYVVQITQPEQHVKAFETLQDSEDDFDSQYNKYTYSETGDIVFDEAEPEQNEELENFQDQFNGIPEEPIKEQLEPSLSIHNAIELHDAASKYPYLGNEDNKLSYEEYTIGERPHEKDFPVFGIDVRLLKTESNSTQNTTDAVQVDDTEDLIKNVDPKVISDLLNISRLFILWRETTHSMEQNATSNITEGNCTETNVTLPKSKSNELLLHKNEEEPPKNEEALFVSRVVNAEEMDRTIIRKNQSKNQILESEIRKNFSLIVNDSKSNTVSLSGLPLFLSRVRPPVPTKLPNLVNTEKEFAPTKNESTKGTTWQIPTQTNTDNVKNNGEYFQNNILQKFMSFISNMRKNGLNGKKSIKKIPVLIGKISGENENMGFKEAMGKFKNGH